MTAIAVSLVLYIGFLFGHSYGVVQKEEGERAGYLAASQKYEQRIESYKKRLDSFEKISQTPEVSNQDWMEIQFFEGKKFYYSQLATPSLFKEPMHYIWLKDGCYAFPSNEITFDEIVELFFRKKRAELDVEKYSGSAEFL